jgi:hypothetical protein
MFTRFKLIPFTLNGRIRMRTLFSSALVLGAFFLSAQAPGHAHGHTVGITLYQCNADDAKNAPNATYTNVGNRLAIRLKSTANAGFTNQAGLMLQLRNHPITVHTFSLEAEDRPTDLAKTYVLALGFIAGTHRTFALATPLTEGKNGPEGSDGFMKISFSFQTLGLPHGAAVTSMGVAVIDDGFEFLDSVIIDGVPTTKIMQTTDDCPLGTSFTVN